MKIEFFKRCVGGMTTVVLCLTGVHSPFNSAAQAQPAPPPPDSATESSVLPPNIYPTSPLAQVVRLTQAGVDESIIMTYVTNSGSTFNLDSDKIIYLKDLGLPSGVVTAMMQRDQQLQQQMAATAYQPPAQPASAPPTVTTDQPETAPPPTEDQPAPPPMEVTVNNFYDTLAPYGTWVNVDGYGQCWRPSVVVYNPGWQPYCDHGHWVYTDCGWYWFSDYSWGWAPFHYGRWFQHSRWGWCWAPDTVWGPSWVTWRYSSDYCGWAPLPPFATYQAGIGFFYRGNAVSIGFNWGLSANCFIFVPTQHFCDPHPRRFCAAPAQVTQIFNQTTVINNFNGQGRNLANRGIDPERITAVTRTVIRPVAIRDTAAPFGHGPHGDQLSRDGNTLIIGHPPQPGSPAQNHFPQPNDNWPASQTRQIRQPQENHAISVPAERPPSPVNYYSSPPPAGTIPSYNNRIYSPRAKEQQPSGTPYSNTRNPETPVVAPIPSQGQHNAPAAAPVERPQRSQPPNEPAYAPTPQNYENQAGPGNGLRH